MRRFQSLFLLGSLFLQLICICKVACDEEKPRIAIVGGGIGGASAVHFLEEYFGPSNVTIDLFEPHNIGGRLATLAVAGNEFEVGGSVIHPRNLLVRKFMKLLGLKEKELPPSQFALFDGDKVVFAADYNWKLLNALKLLLRYGLGPYYLNRYVQNMLTKFDRIYPSLSSGNHYATVDEILHFMSPEFVGYLKESTHDGFKKYGLDELVIKELIEATLTVNYGQNWNVHQFVGSVSVAGVSGGLYAVQGGNRLIPEGLLRDSNAMIIKARVTNITLQETGDYLLHYTDPSSTVNSSLYDIVILAIPLAENIQSGLQFSNFPKKFLFPGKYHQTVSTVVAGTLNYSYFDVSEDVTGIFSVNEKLFFRSVGKTIPVGGESSMHKTDVWKVFSSEPLTKKELDLLFTKRIASKSKTWLAYPHYSTHQRSDRFELHSKLYHINGIEWAASAMEMSAIGGKNVANLAFKDWTGDAPESGLKIEKDEL